MRLQLVNISFKLGLPAFNPNANSVIFKPFQRIIKNGRETGYISHLFLNTDDKNIQCIEGDIGALNERLMSEEFQSQIPPEELKVLGCICYTKGKKILYYPPFATTYLTKFKNRDKIERHIEDISIDHFSLETSFKKWHVTHSNGHIKNFKTYRIDKNIIHWFSMSIDSQVELEQVYQHNAFDYFCPVSDAERRIQDIESSLKYRDQHLIIAPIGDRYNKENYFYHFEFYIKTDSSIASKEPGIIQIPGPCILNIPTSEEIQYISYEMDIPKFNGKLILVATKISGKLTDSVILACSP